MSWLLLRRFSQIVILGLFLLGPLAGVWWVKGSLASSMSFGVVPLTDPLVFLQTIAAGQKPASLALLGAALVAGFYLLIGGRVFCAWVCPVNMLSDLAAWLHRRLGLKPVFRTRPASRYYLLVMILVLCGGLGTAVWEPVNPVTGISRGLIFGLQGAALLALALFIYELFVSPRGWCRICPTGALYGLLGRFSIIRVRADNRHNCDQCGACLTVCPEPQVLSFLHVSRSQRSNNEGGQEAGEVPGNGQKKPLQENDSPVVRSGLCTNCGRCIDSCHRDVFRFGSRFE